jgi:hypothetical protein
MTHHPTNVICGALSQVTRQFIRSSGLISSRGGLGRHARGSSWESLTAQREESPMYIGIGTVVLIIIIVVVVLALRR